MQASAITLELSVAGWLCGNPLCGRQTFVDRLPEIAPPFARRMRRVEEVVCALAHAAGRQVCGLSASTPGVVARVPIMERS
jgi:hypothetical protein